MATATSMRGAMSGADPPPDDPGAGRQLLTRLGRMLRKARTVAWRLRYVILLASIYFAIGAYVTLHGDVIVLDSLSRTAHAYFVWHNDPPKLAAIGLVWPPMTTLPLLPFTLLSGFGRSGLAAPLQSATAMAVIIVFVARELRSLDAPALLRIPLIVLLAVHPMIVNYGANGMSEVWPLLLTTVALAALLRWHVTRSFAAVSAASFACALAVLTRYELGLFVVLVGICLVGTSLVEERDVPKTRALGIFFAFPIIYAMGIWMYVNLAMTGSPVWFLTGGGQLNTVTGTSDLQTARIEGIAALARVHGAMFPLTILCAAALLVWAIRTRSVFTTMLAAIVAYNPITSILLMVLSGNLGLSQLRYNMRSIPLAVLAAAWLYVQLRQRGHMKTARTWAVATVACAVIALPGAGWLMLHHPYQFFEQPFLRSLTGERLTHTYAFNGQPVGCAGAREMGSWIERNITSRNSILADDSSSYAVMLYSGHPERFVDRIDHGDAYFIDQVGFPRHKIKYLLAADFGFCAGVPTDLIAERYKKLGYNLALMRPPGLTLVHATTAFRLLRIDHDELQQFMQEKADLTPVRRRRPDKG